jgi:hypothetical protein
MDGFQFDAWTRRCLDVAASRRQTLIGVLLGACFLRQGTEVGSAGPGCKNVGKPCQKKKDCCSGICKGKKGKKKCKAHDSGGCQPTADTCGQDIDCTTSTGEMGTCFTTTGNAGYCANDGGCSPCTRDADCKPLCGPQAACVRCTYCLAGACFGPSGSSCNFAP